MHMRDKEFTSFAFHIDDNSLPVLEEDYKVTVVKQRDPQLTTLPKTVHKEILDELFSQYKPTNYAEMVARIGESYTAHGYKRGLVAYKELLKLLSASGIIKNENKVYHYYPHILNIQE
jgi:hypothetical protein